MLACGDSYIPAVASSQTTGAGGSAGGAKRIVYTLTCGQDIAVIALSTDEMESLAVLGEYSSDESLFGSFES